MSPRKRTDVLDAPLSPRELEVIQHVANGLKAQGIADLLGISVRTVEVFQMRAYRKLGAKSSAHTIALAFRKGLIK